MCEFHGSNGNGFGDIWWTDNPIYFSSIDKQQNVMGRYGDKARHAEGRMVVDFKTRMEMAVLNNYFKERRSTW